MKYDLSAIDLLKIIGYSQGNTDEFKKYEEENQIRIPALLFDFLSFAFGCPLLATADIWTKSKPYFFYDEIRERIDEDMEYWSENPDEDFSDNEYYQFSQIPEEEWNTKVNNYLEIGSDYAAGVVTFGIRTTDLADENPPVYMLHEANELTEWQMVCDHLSEFLMMVTCDVLTCASYNTGLEIAKKSGWNYQKHSNMDDIELILSSLDFDVDKAAKFTSLYGNDVEAYCFYEEASNTIYLLCKEESSIELWEIVR